MDGEGAGRKSDRVCRKVLPYPLFSPNDVGIGHYQRYAIAFHRPIYIYIYKWIISIWNINVYIYIYIDGFKGVFFAKSGRDGFKSLFFEVWAR